MFIVLVLSYESNGSLRVIIVKHWKIDIIDEPYKFILAEWTECDTCSLLNLLLEVDLQKCGIGIIVEVDDLLEVFISCITMCCKIVEETFSDLSLSTTRITDQHW